MAHVPERIAENHFVEEIATLPCIVGGVGEGSGARAAELFEVFGTEIVQTSPTEAELAKIWTNILRYTQFALPNLLMMECEQYGANVFEVIDLINHDYPRGGMAAPGLTAGACLRKDFTFSEERSSGPGMLLAVSRVHETVPLFLVKGLKSRLGGSLRDLKVAVLGLTFKRDSDDVRDSLSYKLVRMLERELAHVARHDPNVPAESEPLESALEGADAVVIATNHSDFEGLAGAAARGHAAGRPLERDGRRAGVRHGARARRGRVTPARVLVTGGAGTIGSAVVRRLLRRAGRRGAGVRSARGARLDARGERGAHRESAGPARGRRGGRGLHPRDPPGGDRRRDRQLPPAAAHPAGGEHRPLQRGLPGRPGAAGRAAGLRVLVDGVRAGHRVPHVRGAPARLPAAAVGLRLLQADRRGVLPRPARRARPPLHHLPPLQRLRARRASRRRARHRPRRARPDRQGAGRPPAAADLRLGRADPHAHPRGRHRRRDRHRHVPSRRRERGLQHLRRPRSGPWRRSRR